jgi:hypothetical protein
MLGRPQQGSVAPVGEMGMAVFAVADGHHCDFRIMPASCAIRTAAAQRFIIGMRRQDHRPRARRHQLAQFDLG